MPRTVSLSRWVRALSREAVDTMRVRAAVRQGVARNPVLVYQMGKVGSSTVVATLEALGHDLPIFHLHRLDPAKLDLATAKQRRSISPGLPEHLLVGKALGQRLSRTEMPCRIVTLARDPWARILSHLFEDRKKKMPEAIRPDGTIDLTKARVVLDRLMASRSSGLIDPSKWFDVEIRGQFGIDIFETPYDFEKGYTLIPHPKTPVLILRLEDINRALPTALADLLGLRAGEIDIVRANEGADKRYASSLSEAKAHFAPSAALSERLCSTRYFQHFYAANPPSWVGEG